MAVNKASGSPVNALEDDDRFGLSDLGRLRDQWNTEPAAIRSARRRGMEAQSTIAALEEAEEQNPGLSSLPLFKKQLLENTRVRKRVNSRLEVYQEAKQDRLNEQAINMVNRDFSPSAVNSYVAQNSNSLQAQVAGMSMTGQGYGVLAEQRRQIMNQMQGIRQSSVAAASSYIQEGGVNAGSASVLQSGSQQMQELAKQLVPITLAMQQLKQQGLDPKGRQEELARIGNRAAGVLHSNQLENDMKSGTGLGALSMSEIKKKEAEAAEKLIKALGELNNAAGKTTDELAQLNEQAEEAAKEFKDINDVKGMRGGSGGGGGSSTFHAVSSVVAQLANLIGNTIQTMGVTLPMAQMSNVAGFANIENQKFDMWRAGNEGDMTARMNSAGWKNAAIFGNRMGDNTDWAVGARVVGSVAAGVAGVAQTANAWAAVGPELALGEAVQKVAGGILATGEGIAGTMIHGKDKMDQISKSQAKVAGNLQAMQATKELNHVAGYQAQQYRNYLMGLREGAQGLGTGGADAFIDQAGGTEFIDRMIAVGLGSKEMGQLSQFGAANMGSTFTPEQAIQAQRYENFALGSAKENMQRMAAFAEAGSQNPLESMAAVIERAMGAGIDSSKALNLVAENTGQLVAQTYSQGSTFDTADAIGRLLMSAVQKDPANKEFATKQAISTFKTEEDWKTNTNISVAGMISLARTQNDLGLDTQSAIAWEGKPTAMIAEWAKQIELGNIEDVKQDMFRQGISVYNNPRFEGNPSNWFKTGQSNRVLKQVERGMKGVAYGASQDFARLAQWIETEEYVSENAPSVADKKAMFAGENEALLHDPRTPDWVRKAMLNINQSVEGNPDAVRRDMAVGKGWRNVEKGVLPEWNLGAYNFVQMDYIRGVQQQGEDMKQGMSHVGAAGGTGTDGGAGIWMTGEVHGASAGTTGAEAAEQWATAAARSAQSFGESAAKLDGASSELTRAANALLYASGATALNSSDITKKIREIEKKLKISEAVNKLKGETKQPGKDQK